MSAATVNEIGASIPYVRDMKSLIESLKERDLYVIARVAAFRDSYLAEKKPEWSLTLPDGSLYRDRQGMGLGGSVPPRSLGLSSGSWE